MTQAVFVGKRSKPWATGYSFLLGLPVVPGKVVAEPKSAVQVKAEAEPKPQRREKSRARRRGSSESSVEHRRRKSKPASKRAKRSGRSSDSSVTSASSRSRSSSDSSVSSSSSDSSSVSSVSTVERLSRRIRQKEKSERKALERQPDNKYLSGKSGSSVNLKKNVAAVEVNQKPNFVGFQPQNPQLRKPSATPDSTVVTVSSESPEVLFIRNRHEPVTQAPTVITISSESPEAPSAYPQMPDLSCDGHQPIHPSFSPRRQEVVHSQMPNGLKPNAYGSTGPSYSPPTLFKPRSQGIFHPELPNGSSYHACEPKNLSHSPYQPDRQGLDLSLKATPAARFNQIARIPPSSQAILPHPVDLSQTGVKKEVQIVVPKSSSVVPLDLSKQNSSVLGRQDMPTHSQIPKPKSVETQPIDPMQAGSHHLDVQIELVSEHKNGRLFKTLQPISLLFEKFLPSLSQCHPVEPEIDINPGEHTTVPFTIESGTEARLSFNSSEVTSLERRSPSVKASSSSDRSPYSLDTGLEKSNKDPESKLQDISPIDRADDHALVFAVRQEDKLDGLLTSASKDAAPAPVSETPNAVDKTCTGIKLTEEIILEGESAECMLKKDQPLDSNPTSPCFLLDMGRITAKCFVPDCLNDLTEKIVLTEAASLLTACGACGALYIFRDVLGSQDDPVGRG